jgi:hypothetical protein
MNTYLLSVYILVWPAISAVILYVLCRGVAKDIRDASRENRELV